MQHRAFTRHATSCARSRKDSRGRSDIYSEDHVDVIFRIANETQEMQSPNFSLALRRRARLPWNIRCLKLPFPRIQTSLRWE